MCRKAVSYTSRLACFTLDFERDFGRRLGDYEAFDLLTNDSAFARLKAICQGGGVKITAFIVGQLLDEHPEMIERLSELDVEFELHSYSHRSDPPINPPSEIERAVAAYHRYFGRSPQGYRAPYGRITDGEVRMLYEQGFRYDSSIFPSYRLGMYNNLRQPMTPYYHKHVPLLEIPVSAVPFVRLPVSLSYIKLLGWGAYRMLFDAFGLPRILVFSFHLHDLFAEMSYACLHWSDRWRWMRNRSRGFGILECFINYLRERGYEFVFLSRVAEIVTARSVYDVVSA